MKRNSWIGVGGLLTAAFLVGGAEPVKPAALPRIRIAADGRTFETDKGRPFVPIGVNYYRPGTGWAPQVWKQFDATATRNDFARMKELGVNCARVFISYGSFCMTAGKLDPEGLAKFDEFVRIAEEAGIYVHPTGPDHWEGVADWAKVDRYADEQALAGVESFWKLFAARYRGRPVIFAYDLLNEPEVKWDTSPMREKWNRWLETKYTTPEKLASSWGATNQSLTFGSISIPPKEDCAGCARLLDFQHFREDVADEWTRRQVAAIKSADPRALVTVGLIQWSVPSVIAACWHYSAFRPERQARFVDFMEIHFYPLANGHYEYKDADEEAKNLAYLEGVVREVARFNKPVIIAEFGWYGGGKLSFGNHAPATKEQHAQWCRKLVESTAGLATGWLNWGFYDQPEAGDVSQLTGLLTADGKMKAWGREFKTLADRYSNRTIPLLKLGARPALDWDLCITSAGKGAEFRAEYLKAWKADHQ